MRILKWFLAPFVIFAAGFGSGFAIAVLPIAAVMMAIAYVFKPKDRIKHLNLFGHVLLILVFLILICGVTAPCLAVNMIFSRLGLLGEVPPVMPAFRMIWALSDDLTPDRTPVAAGICGVIVALSLSWFNVFWRLLQARQVDNLPTAKARSAAIGLCEFQGIARRDSSRQKAATDPILWVRWNRSSGAQQEHVEPFYLEDETGRILVDPKGATFRAGWSDILQGRCCEIALARHIETSGQAVEKRGLMLGDAVYLIGNVQRNPHRKEGVDSEALVVGPLRETWLPNFMRILGDVKAEERWGPQNVFFLSDSSEASAKKRILQGLWQVLLVAGIWIGLSLLLVWLGLSR